MQAEFLQTLTNLVPTSKGPREKKESSYRRTDCLNSSPRRRNKNNSIARRQLKEASSSLWRLCNFSWWMTQMTWWKEWVGSCRRWATPAASKTQSTADLTCGRWCQEAWRMSFRSSTGYSKRICSHRYLRISFWKMPNFLKWITKREPNTKKKPQTSLKSNTIAIINWAVTGSRILTKTKSGRKMIAKYRQLTKKWWDREVVRRSTPTVPKQKSTITRELKNCSPRTKSSNWRTTASREKGDMY